MRWHPIHTEHHVREVARGVEVEEACHLAVRATEHAFEIAWVADLEQASCPRPALRLARAGPYGAAAELELLEQVIRHKPKLRAELAKIVAG